MFPVAGRVDRTASRRASVSRTYDTDFRVATHSVNSGNTVSYGYDGDGLLTGSGSLSVTRDPQTGLVIGTTLRLVTDVTAYNGFGEPLTYSASYNGTQLYAVQYHHDVLGRMTEKTETIGGATHTYDYTYDLAGRLTDVTTDSVPTAHYDYDSNSNRTGGFNAAGAITNTQYDDQDRLLAFNLDLSPFTYSYTANGELLTKTDASGTTTYAYDVLGNLTTVTLPDGTQIQYVVDGKNRRIGKKVNAALVQGWLYGGQLRIVAELDGSGNLVSRFVYGEQANAPEYMIKGGVTYRLLPDHLGSPRLVVNVADGTVVQRMDYDEFGNVLADTNPGFQPFGFAGGLHDRDTKLVRFEARDYDATTGRWSAKDPIGFNGGDANLYGYVVSDPINAIDPPGLWGGGATIVLPAPGAVINWAALGVRAGTIGLVGGMAMCLSGDNPPRYEPKDCPFTGFSVREGPVLICEYKCEGEPAFFRQGNADGTCDPWWPNPIGPTYH